MKKRTLTILLIIPFIISLLTFVSVKILDNKVAVDILGIEWNYKENEGFRVDENNGYELKAKAIVDPDLVLAKGNNLVWTTKKINADDEDYAEVRLNDGVYSLYALKPGQVEVVCSNERGSVSKYFTATIYQDGAMVINPTRNGSGSNIDSTKYYGTYDLSYTSLEKDNYTKKNTTFSVTATTFADGKESDESILVDKSDNISYDADKKEVTILNPGDSYLTLKSTDGDFQATYTFDAIDGVNIYSYDDLLMATNFSTDGENIVMQTNLDSLKNVYQTDEEGNYINVKKDNEDNTELFGHYDFENQTYSFEKEYYTFETTYDSTYIDYYNSKTGSDIKKQVIAGIHIQKDVYGNGYTINMDGLCYPHKGKIDSDTGKLTPDKEKDYFQGPLPFVSIGNMSSFPLITALGQDNCGFYIDKDNVIVNDLKLSNVNEVDNLYNLAYTGSVIDVESDNVTIKNSIISNGKLCLRAYDSDNLLMDNCILKNGGEFLMMVGSNKKVSYNTDRKVTETFTNVSSDGSKTSIEVDKSFSEFFDNQDESKADTANGRLNRFLGATVDGTLANNDYEDELNKVQKYLDNTDGILDSDGAVSEYAANITVNNTLFGRSGVFSIASESMFNGPLLYGGIPTSVTSLLSMLNSPLPEKIGGTSLPVHVTLSGDTRFYDWKDIDSIDVSSLIEENISLTLQQLGMGDKNVTIDEVFPMKEALKNEASKQGYIYTKDGKSYINTAIAYYGGGLNVSRIDNKSTTAYNTFSDEIDVSLIEYLKNSGKSGNRAVLVDCVVVTIGSHPFRFVVNGEDESTDPILFDKVPTIEDLKNNISK